MYKLVGLREEKYIGKRLVYALPSSSPNIFEEQEMTRHVILLVHNVSGQKVELTLSVRQTEIDEWSTTTHNWWDWRDVDVFAGKTHTIKEERVLLDVPVHVHTKYISNYDNGYFSFHGRGNLEYNPHLKYHIYMEAFEDVPNAILDKRPVHIFYGDSNSCKSYLAALTGKTVFETDSVSSKEELPKVLTQEVIVIGNRWECSLADIKERLFGDCQIIEVNFTIGK